MRTRSAVVLGLLLLAGPRAFAQSFEEELKAMADGVAKVVKEKGGRIALGDLTDASTSKSNSGPGLMNEVGGLLKSKSVKIDADAPLLLKGDYGVKVDGDLIKVRIELRILERSGEEVATLPNRFTVPVIAQNAQIALLLGLTVHLPPAGDAPVRNNEIKAALKKEALPHLEGNVVKTLWKFVNDKKEEQQEISPYGVEIRVKGAVKAKGEPRQPFLNDGKAFVDIKEGELYEIVLHNDSGQEAAARIAIDGLDVFTFSDDKKPDGKPKFTHFLVPPKKSVTIKGWHRSNKKLAEGNIWSFLVAEYGKGSDSALKSSGNVGVVSVVFSVSYLSKEELAQGERSARDVQKETSRGPLDHENFKAAERFIGIERDVISIRYSR